MSSIKNIYKDKKVLITGHTGFKGSWLSVWLTKLGAHVIGVSNNIPTIPSNFEASAVSSLVEDHRIDIMDFNKVNNVISKSEPDFIFHLAAQALVYPAYENPLQTLLINSMGTANILESIRLLEKPLVAVMITSDKAYDNVEWVWGYKETDALGGKDPYSASKGMAELAIKTYVESYFTSPDNGVRLGITRAGNVIGGGDWAEKRIVPDCMEAWRNNNVVEIRRPDATRPWQHVLEPLSGYLSLGAELYNNPQKHGQAYNFGPSASQNYSVRQLIDEMSLSWSNVRWDDVSKDEKHLHEAGLLKLNCDKALFDLKWLPTMQFAETVKMTVDWYKAFYETKGDSMQEFTYSQIDQYTRLAKDRERFWTAL